MKVIQIDSTCKYGSTGEIVYNLYNHIRNVGEDAAVFYGRGRELNENNIYKFGLDWETNLHAGLARITGYNGCFSPISTRRLIQHIEEFKPDIIHIHELHAYFVNIKSLIEYIKHKNIPVVWTFHCEYMYTGKCGHAGTCEQWMTRCEKCPQVREYPKSLFFDKTSHMFEMKKELLKGLNAIYVTPSNFFAERVRKSFLKDSRVEVIHNGINTEIYYPRKKGNVRKRLGIAANKTILLSVAPNILSDIKGGNWIIQLAKRENNKNIEYVLVGDGEKISKIGENVTIVPLIKNKDCLAEIYSEADCFILCSQHETFSLTCAEALCCGIPVAGFKCDAPETIFKEPWARFVEYGDLSALREIIDLQINSNHTEISSYGINEFCNNTMFSSYMNLYKDILGVSL